MPNPLSREEELYRAALQQPIADRDAFLAGACHGNPALRQRLDAMLAEEKTETRAPQKRDVAKPTIKIEFTDENLGQMMGRYKLMEKIGEGGCGMVYVAEQTEPVHRRVALKLIKLGMDTKQVVARFDAERQALAMMDHPNIARVLDAGAGDQGRPYFVMELVRGIRITDYCDQAQLSTEERLGLFIKVCQAIQHAHQKGIIHRDIKPSNILVALHDGVPVPKVIDFGIAKAMEGRLSEATVYTQLNQFIGTPAYMSPEQAEMSGLDIDTRSDIYSLGVLLYELLTGSTPFDARELLASGIDMIRKTIREREPLRPSTKLANLQLSELTTTAKRRSTDSYRLTRLLKGDLDWIVMKCLEKDRTRRYETANGLAADIRYHLNNEPVTARPPSTLYRFQKAARRNKTLFVAAGVGAAALIGGLVVALCLYAQEKAAVKRAVAAEHAEAELRRHAEQSAAWSQQIEQAGLLLMRQQYYESERKLAGVPPHETLAPFYNVFGNLHGSHQEWKEALTNWNLVVQYAPNDHIGYHHLAPLLLQLGDTERYQNCRAEILRRFGNTSDPQIAERLTKDCLILPADASQLPVIKQMADVTGRTDTNSNTWGFNLFAQALADYRLGHFTMAASRLEKVTTLDVGRECRTQTYIVLAMALFQINQPNESHAALATAREAMEHQLPKTGYLGDEWNDWIIAHILMREASELIEENP